MRARKLATLLTAISMIAVPVATASSGHALSTYKKCGKTKAHHTNCGKHKAKGKSK